RAAEEEATQERDRARDAEKRAGEEKSNAQASLKFLVNDVLGQADPFQRLDSPLTVVSMLKGASDRLEARKDMPPLVEAEIRNSLGDLYEKHGDIEKGISYRKRAFELRRGALRDDDPVLLETAHGLSSAYWMVSDYANAKTYAEFEYNGR